MIDTARIIVKAGKGGNGASLFRREKYIPRGGPWGGDGGKGGDVIFQVDSHVNTLIAFQRAKVFKAKEGENGGRSRQTGSNGSDLIIKVPQGTVVYDDKKNLLCDLTDIGYKQTIAEGGRGGLGNWHFKSSINQAPKKATLGTPGEEKTLYLELKLLADVGIIGLPSSGKSTLLNSLTHSNVKTAEYHFTTLEPNLGVLHVNEFLNREKRDIILADIPGLIEGASNGKGLGHDFLRHIERTKVLVHMIDGSSVLNSNVQSLDRDYEVIVEELKSWSSILLSKPQIVVVNKIDITEVREKIDEITKLFAKKETPLIFVSAVTKEGFTELITTLIKVLDSHNKKQADQKEDLTNKEPSIKKVFTMKDLKNRRIVFDKEEKVKEKDYQ